MRGRPWLRLVLVCIGLGLMGIPVLTLTQAKAPEEVAATVAPSEQKNLAITVRFAHAPESFALSCLGKPVLTGTGPAMEFQGTWPVALNTDGVDMLLKVKWPASAPQTAVEVKVGDGGNVLADRTFWATGELTEIVTVQPEKP